MSIYSRFAAPCCLLFLPLLCRAHETIPVRGEVVDADSGKPLACRVYLRDAQAQWHFARSASDAGSAVEYRKTRGRRSVEMHTTLSAHPFRADLPAGEYTVTVERGKEYLPQTKTIEVRNGLPPLKFQLRRWIDMSRHGWYSGDTHVHRSIEELPNVMLAEDLNVALPLTYWVTRSDTPPERGDKNSPAAEAKPITIDDTHVIYPMNTEYEIFTVGGKRHTLGAVFALNHKEVLPLGAPPVVPIAEQVRRQGGLLELDKHNWPWSMMLAPVMDVDLYELTNNHIWRTQFFFRRFGEQPPAYMKVERDADGMTEQGWIDFGFQNYYALVNCGFRMRPTAGTASGVHPVPLGFGRVYVHLPDGFSYESWIAGLDAGRSFVTTGPMLVVHVNDRPAGTTIRSEEASARYRIRGWARSANRLTRIEIIAAGEVVKTIEPRHTATDSRGFETPIDETVEIDGSSWIAVRCWATTADGRVRFAHTSPVHIDVANRPLRPRRREVEYLVQRVETQIERNESVLPAAAMQEYRAALKAYEKLLSEAR